MTIAPGRDVAVEEGDEGLVVGRDGREEHGLRLDAPDDGRLEVDDDDELLADQVLGGVGLGDPGDHLPLLRADIDLELEDLGRAGNALRFEDLGHPEVHSS